MNTLFNMLWKIGFFAVVLGILTACQTNSRKDIRVTKAANGGTKVCGISRGSFLGSWFDYYERGLSFADCGMWVESEQDLRKALSTRSIDRRRVYSLGMHLIKNYFPNRELGIALYHQKKYSEAEKFLELSMSQYPSSKAEEYLKRVRAAKLSQNNSDTVPPTIQISSHKPNSVNRSSTIRVRGLVKDDSYIEKVEVNGVPYRHIPTFTSETGTPVRVARSVSELNFSLDVPVQQKDGKAIIEVVATDISGKKTVSTVPVHIDMQGPQINVKKINKTQDQKINLVVDIRDKQSDIKQVNINNKEYNIQTKQVRDSASGELIYEVHVDELISGPFDSEHILVIAKDTVGNKTRAEVTIPPVFDGSIDSSLAGAVPLSIFLAKEQVNRRTHEKTAYIEGEVESESDIIKLQINDDNILNGQAKHVYFNYHSELKVGDNIFNLVVENQQGEIQRKTFNIKRTVPPSHSIKERLMLAQFPFPCNEISRNPCDVSASLYETLNKKLIDRKRFQITEQDKVNELIDKTGICDDGISDACVVKIADTLISKRVWKKAFANSMLTGTVIERRSNLDVVSIEISALVIDNDTKETLTSVDIYAENLNPSNFNQFSQGLITEISDAFPLVDADIKEITTEGLLINIDEQDELWENMPILVYEKNKRKSCGNARFHQEHGTNAQAIMVSKTCNNITVDQHRVITR